MGRSKIDAMHILFVHQNFPAQFGHIAEYLASKLGYRCTFVSQKPAGQFGGVDMYYVVAGVTADDSDWSGR